MLRLHKCRLIVRTYTSIHNCTADTDRICRYWYPIYPLYLYNSLYSRPIFVSIVLVHSSYEPSFCAFRLQVCPFCHDMKSHLRDHVLRCRLGSSDATHRTREQIDDILDLEKKRKARIEAYSRSVLQLKDYYGDQWVVAADALRQAGIPVYSDADIGMNCDENLVTELDFDGFLTRHGIQFTRSARHFHAGPAPTGVANRAAISSTSRGVNTSPVRNERVAGKNLKRGASTPSLRDGPVVSTASTSSFAPGPQPVSTSVASTSSNAPGLPPVSTSVASTSSSTPGSQPVSTSVASTSSNAPGLPPVSTSVASTSSSTPGSQHVSTSVASTSSFAPGSQPVSTSVASTSSFAPGSLPPLPSLPDDPDLHTLSLAPEKFTALNSGIDDPETVASTSSFAQGSLPDDTETVASTSLAAEDGDTSLPSVLFSLPDDTDAFRDEFLLARDELDWDSVIHMSQWMEKKYGLGIKTNLNDQTSYFALFEEFTNAVDAKLQISLIETVKNSPGMPTLDHTERELLVVLVAVYHLAFPYIIDHSNLPRSDATPPPPPPRIDHSNLPRSDATPPPPPRAAKRRARVIVSSDEESDRSPVTETPRKKQCLRSSPRGGLPRIDYNETALSPPLRREADSPKGKSNKSSPRIKTPGRVGVPINLRVGREAEAALAEDPTIELESNVRSQLVKKRLQKMNISVGCEKTKHLLDEMPLLIEYLVYAKGMCWSPDHHTNMIGNLTRMFGFYTGGIPYTFQTDMLHDVQKFYSFVSSLEDAGCKSETVKKYMEAARTFFKFLYTDLKYQTNHEAIRRLDIYAESVQKRKNKQANTERKVRLSRSNLDESKAQLRQVVTDMKDRLKPKVDAFFESIEGKDRSEIAITAQQLQMVNVYFFCFFLRLGHRPIAFLKFPLSMYKLAKAQGPIADRDIIGDAYRLSTDKHKTSGSYQDVTVSLDVPTFERLITYVNCLRPRPANAAAREILWLNSTGTPVSHISDNLKKVMQRVDGGKYCPSLIRHALATVGYNTFSGTDREEFVTSMAHSVQTADRHYVNDKSRKKARGEIKNLSLTMTEDEAKAYDIQLARRAAEAKAKKKVAKNRLPATARHSVLLNAGQVDDLTDDSDDDVNDPPQVEISVSDPPQVRASSPAPSSVRSASPALSIASKASSSSSGYGPPARRSEHVARQEFIAEHLTVTADEMPSFEEFERQLKQHRYDYPELKHTSWKQVRESSREIHNKLKGNRFAEGLGRKKLKNVEKDMESLLKEAGLYSARACQAAVKRYLDIQAKFTRTAHIERTAASEAGPSDLLRQSVTTSIYKQRWNQIRITEREGKGQCVIANGPITRGTVVCDYYAKLLDWSVGHSKYKSNTSDSNTYMLAVQYASKRFYLDGTDEHCSCHPTTKLKGRLINHSQNGNLKPVLNFLDGKPVLLLVATRDIEDREEVTFDYQCQKDSLSNKQPWMKE